MKRQDLNRFTPLTLKSGHRLQNRVVVPPMASGTASLSGEVTEETLSHYRRLSQSRAAMIWVEYTFVSPGGRSEGNQLGSAHRGHVAGLRKLAATLKKTGATVGIQLTHAGGKSEPQFSEGGLTSPSGIPVPHRTGSFGPSRAISLQEVEQLKEDFLLATERAFEAGFDGVEYHSAHGYGLNQWLSPLTNKRKDAYGGSPENRLRLLREIIETARARYPHKILSARIPGQDLHPGGLSLADMATVGKHLEVAGLNIIDVSSGIGGWRRPPGRRGQGYLLTEAKNLQQAVNLPVIGVGGIQEGEFIDEALRHGHLSLAAVGRAILEAPEKWGNKNLQAPTIIQSFYPRRSAFPHSGQSHYPLMKGA